jgi:hypothetical protein
MRRRLARLAGSVAKLPCLSNKGGYVADGEYPMQMEMMPRLTLLAASHDSVGRVSPRPSDRNSGDMDTCVPSASKFANLLRRALMGARRHAVAALQRSLSLRTGRPVAGTGVRFYRVVLG